jgi:hypothetical protein
MPATYLETRTVSRKTPRDGRLEITTTAAKKLEGCGPLTARVAGDTAEAILDTYPCQCRGPEHRHVHFFLKSDLFKALVPESRVRLELDSDAGRIELQPE